MPWTKKDYPSSMKNLKERVRNKAIEIANALLQEGYDEDRAIPIAISQAEKWDQDHPEDQVSTKNCKKISATKAEQLVSINQKGAVAKVSNKKTVHEAKLLHESFLFWLMLANYPIFVTLTFD